MLIQITNLDINLNEADLQRTFKPYGEVGDVRIERDHRTNRSRGKAMVEMPVAKEARNAIEHLDGLLMGAKKIALAGNNDVEESRFMAW